MQKYCRALFCPLTILLSLRSKMRQLCWNWHCCTYQLTVTSGDSPPTEATVRTIDPWSADSSHSITVLAHYNYHRTGAFPTRKFDRNVVHARIGSQRPMMWTRWWLRATKDSKVVDWKHVQLSRWHLISSPVLFKWFLSNNTLLRRRHDRDSVRHNFLLTPTQQK